MLIRVAARCPRAGDHLSCLFHPLACLDPMHAPPDSLHLPHAHPWGSCGVGGESWPVRGRESLPFCSARRPIEWEGSRDLPSAMYAGTGGFDGAFFKEYAMKSGPASTTPWRSRVCSTPIGRSIGMFTWSRCSAGYALRRKPWAPATGGGTPIDGQRSWAGMRRFGPGDRLSRQFDPAPPNCDRAQSARASASSR